MTPARAAPSLAWRSLLGAVSAAAFATVLVLGMTRALQEGEPEPAQPDPATTVRTGDSAASLPRASARHPEVASVAPAAPRAAVIAAAAPRPLAAAPQPTLPTRAVLAIEKPSRLPPMAADGTAPEPPADAN